MSGAFHSMYTRAGSIHAKTLNEYIALNEYIGLSPILCADISECSSRFRRKLIHVFVCTWDGFSNLDIWGKVFNRKGSDGEILHSLSVLYKELRKLHNVPPTPEAEFKAAWQNAEEQCGQDLHTLPDIDPPESVSGVELFKRVLDRLADQMRIGDYCVANNLLGEYVHLMMTPYVIEILSDLARYIAKSSDSKMAETVIQFRPSGREMALMWKYYIHVSVIIEAMALGNEQIVAQFGRVTGQDDSFLSKFVDRYNTGSDIEKDAMVASFEKVKRNHYVIGSAGPESTKYKSVNAFRNADHRNRIIHSIERGIVGQGSFGQVFRPHKLCREGTSGEGVGPTIGKICPYDADCQEEAVHAQEIQKIPGYEKYFAKIYPACEIGGEVRVTQLIYEDLGSDTFGDILTRALTQYFDIELVLNTGTKMPTGHFIREKIIDSKMHRDDTLELFALEQTYANILKDDNTSHKDVMQNKVRQFLKEAIDQWHKCKECFVKIFSGFEFMHNKGIIHGDCHIFNIMVNDSGPIAPKFIDYGTCMCLGDMRGRELASLARDDEKRRPYEYLLSVAEGITNAGKRGFDPNPVFEAIVIDNVISLFDIVMFFNVEAVGKLISYMFPEHEGVVKAVMLDMNTFTRVKKDRKHMSYMYPNDKCRKEAEINMSDVRKITHIQPSIAMYTQGWGLQRFNAVMKMFTLKV